MQKPGTPLPAALSGSTIERLVRIDEALIYLVNGALEWLCDKEPFEQTGALTPETAKTALSDMFQTYFDEEPIVIPIGQITPFGSTTIPAKWKRCDGSAISRATYADLFAIIGTNYGVGDGSTTFNLPDMRGRSPYGYGDASIPALGNSGGAVTHTLTLAETPAHDHGFFDNGHDHRIPKASATVNAGVNTSTPNARTDTAATPTMRTDPAVANISFSSAGGDGSHNNLHPVLGVNFIIYAGA